MHILNIYTCAYMRTCIHSQNTKCTDLLIHNSQVYTCIHRPYLVIHRTYTHVLTCIHVYTHKTHKAIPAHSSVSSPEQAGIHSQNTKCTDLLIHSTHAYMYTLTKHTKPYLLIHRFPLLNRQVFQLSQESRLEIAQEKYTRALLACTRRTAQTVNVLRFV